MRIFQILFINFFKLMKIIRAILVYTFMYDEEFTVFLRNQSITTMRTAKLYRRVSTYILWKACVADLAEELTFGTIVLIEIDFRCTTTRATAVIGDLTPWVTTNRCNSLPITFFKVRNEILISPILSEVSDKRKLINFKFLILRGMGIIKSPLFKRDISADKV